MKKLNFIIIGMICMRCDQGIFASHKEKINAHMTKNITKEKMDIEKFESPIPEARQLSDVKAPIKQKIKNQKNINEFQTKFSPESSDKKNYQYDSSFVKAPEKNNFAPIQGSSKKIGKFKKTTHQENIQEKINRKK
jgi:hypothetical protein